MDVRSLILAATCSALVRSCGERTEPPASGSARAPTALDSSALESSGEWPDTIVAERNRFLPEGVESDLDATVQVVHVSPPRAIEEPEEGEAAEEEGERRAEVAGEVHVGAPGRRTAGV